MGCELELTRKACKGSTYFIKIRVKDEYNTLVSPQTLKWTLKDSDGDLVNNRNKVVVSNPEEENVVSLYGNDLAIDDTIRSTERVFIAEGTYISRHMSNAPFRAVTRFDLINPDHE